jgi:hypothetical protein
MLCECEPREPSRYGAAASRHLSGFFFAFHMQRLIGFSLSGNRPPLSHDFAVLGEMRWR